MMKKDETMFKMTTSKPKKKKKCSMPLSMSKSSGEGNKNQMALVSPNKLEKEDSQGIVDVVGLFTEKFNPTKSAFSFRVTGQTISSDPDDVLALVNGNQVPQSSLNITSTMISVQDHLFSCGWCQ